MVAVVARILMKSRRLGSAGSEAVWVTVSAKVELTFSQTVVGKASPLGARLDWGSALRWRSHRMRPALFQPDFGAARALDPGMSAIESFSGREALADAAADIVAGALGAADARAFAGAGGSTPGPVYDRLARRDLEWRRLSVTLTDAPWGEPAS